MGVLGLRASLNYSSRSDLKSFSVSEVYPIGIGWVCLASLFQGIFGSFSSVLTGVLAYIGSVTTKEERTARMSILLSMSFIAGTIGPFLSGFLATHWSHLAVFICIAFCHLVNIFYIIIFVEPVNADKKIPLTFKNVFSLGHLKDSIRTCFVERTPTERRNIGILIFSAVIVMIVTAGE